MTAWTTISNLLVAVGAKPFATTMQALRDNPIAIAEGASGAPRVQPLAMVGFAANVEHVGTTPDSVVFTYPCERLRVAVHIVGRNTSGSSNFRIRASSDGGATWGAYSNIVDVAQISGSTAQFMGELEISMTSGIWSFAYTRSNSTGSVCQVFRGAATMSVLSGANAIEFSFSAAGTGANPSGNHTVYYIGTAA